VTNNTTPHKGTPHKATPQNATPQNATPQNAQNDMDIIKEFFREQFPGSNDIRIKRLVRVARRIALNKEINIPEQSGASQDEDSIFKNTITQVTKIYRTIEESSDQLYPLCFANAVELSILSIISEASRHSKKNIALNYISDLLDVDKQKVIDLDKEGNTYLTCMEFGGAASLYSINGAKTE
jgi:hypothetical protein